MPIRSDHSILRSLILTCLVLMTTLALSPFDSTAQVNLAWNPETDPGLAGYRVYYGTASRTYGDPIDVGDVTTYRLEGLTPGVQYYIAVTAYNRAGQESGFSNEVSTGLTDETVSAPGVLSGPTTGMTGIPYSYTAGGSVSSLGHPVEYQFDWKGDGSDPSDWGPPTRSESWTDAATYHVRARARCSQDVPAISEWSGSLSVSIGVPSILVTPSAYDFGNVKVQWRKMASFKIKNKGPADLSISTSITDTNASMFTITFGSGTRTIKPGRTLTLWVAFKPLTKGSMTSDLRITPNESGTPSIDILLSGSGQ